MTDRQGNEYRYHFQFRVPDAAGSLAGGAFVGLTGVGLGEFITTLLAVRHRFPIHLATGSAVFVVALTVLSAAVSHVYFLFEADATLPWNLAAVMITAVLVGGQIAPRLARMFLEKFLRGALIFMFVLVGAIMLARGWAGA